MSKSWMKRLVYSIVIIGVIAIGVIAFKSYGFMEGTKKYEKLYDEVTLLPENGKKELDKIFALLESEKHLSDKQVVNLYGWISNIYLFQDEYEKTVNFAEKAIFYGDRAGEAEVVFWSYLDIANMFMMLDYNEIAVELLGYAEDLLKECKGEEDKVIGEDYIHYYYSWAYLGLGDGAKILEHIGYNYQYMQEYSPYFSITKNIVKALGLFDTNQMEEAKNLLIMINEQVSKLPQEEHSVERVLNLETLLLRLKTLLYLEEENLEGAMEEAKKFVAYMDTYDTKSEPLYYFSDFFDVIKKKQITPTKEQEVILMEYKEILLSYYPAELETARVQGGNFVLNSFFASILNQKQVDTTYRMQNNILKSILIAFVIFSVFMYVLGVSLKQNKRDSLTGIYNRRYFNKIYHNLRKKEKDFYLMIFDIDHFKYINDGYGHEYGDKVLEQLSKEVGMILSREETFFRYGGEEFCVISRKNELQSVIDLAERIRERVEAMKWKEDIKVTISIGISKSTEESSSISVADQRMYESKKKGRNTITY